jgi:hypothetical protein
MKGDHVWQAGRIMGSRCRRCGITFGDWLQSNQWIVCAFKFIPGLKRRTKAMR